MMSTLTKYIYTLYKHMATSRHSSKRVDQLIEEMHSWILYSRNCDTCEYEIIREEVNEIYDKFINEEENNKGE